MEALKIAADTDGLPADVIAFLDRLAHQEKGDVRPKAADALRKQGAAAVPVLVRWVKNYDDDFRLRNLGIDKLGEMKSAAADAVPELRKLLPPGETSLRVRVIKALG